MKNILFILLTFFYFNSFSQTTDKTVTLVVNGQGKTQEEAKQNALRSAIEQSFGTFISSKTEILNDNLIKDEIVSITNGNIQNFEIISEIQIPNGGFRTSLKATVSVTKLISFVENKGIAIEFKGSLFAFNVNQLILNESNEALAIKEITAITIDITKKSLFGKILPKDPYLKNGDIYKLPLEIEIHANENINSAVKYLTENLNKLSLTDNQKSEYLKLNKPIYEIILITPKSPINGKFSYKMKPNYSCPIAIPDFNPSEYEFHSIFLRSKKSYDLLMDFIDKSYDEVFKFNIITDNKLILNIDEINGIDCSGSYQTVLANGLIPFASPDKYVDIYSIYGNKKFPIIFTNPYNYLCGGSSLNNTRFPAINKSLARYFCERESSHSRETPFLILLMHLYQKDGLVYQMSVCSDILLSDLGKISNIKIDYLK